MVHVVTGACPGCRHTECVEGCPVDAFREVPDLSMLVIDPDECIGCGGCAPLCPVEAILDEDDVPEGQRHFIEINAVRAKEGVPLDTPKGPLPGAPRRAGGV